MTGLPLNVANIAEDLAYVPVVYTERPWNALDLPTLIEPMRPYIEREILWSACDRGRAWRDEEVKQFLPRVPAQIRNHLSISEFAQIWYSSVVALDCAECFNLHREHDGEPCHKLIAKAASSQWRWGFERDWNALVDFLHGIARFDFGSPGFETALDYTTGYNERGYSAFSRTYLDGVFGFLVHCGGRHVATIGFSLSRERRLLVHQVQMKEKRGNRWLFRLGRPLIDHVLTRLAAAFPGFRLHLVHGSDLARQIEKNYNENAPSAETLRRIERFYAQRLSGYVRRRPARIGGLRFHPLAARAETTAVVARAA